MTVDERLKADLDAALRAGDTDRVKTLRLLRAALQNAQIEARRPLTDAEAEAVLRRQARQRREAIDLYTTGGREELAAVERTELAIVESYLPPEADDTAVEAAVRAAIASTGATGPQDMGRVMSAAMAQLPGTDGGRVSAVAKRVLAEGAP